MWPHTAKWVAYLIWKNSNNFESASCDGLHFSVVNQSSLIWSRLVLLITAAYLLLDYAGKDPNLSNSFLPSKNVTLKSNAYISLVVFGDYFPTVLPHQLRQTHVLHPSPGRHCCGIGSRGWGHRGQAVIPIGI